MEDKLRVLRIMPGKAPEEVEIDSGLSALQEQVGGYIEQICPFEDEVAVICNEEGKLTRLPLNRAIYDPDTGEITEAWIFVGVMTYSQYAFVEAFINEQQKSWITAHVHMYEFFGGVTPILVSDNAPTATNRKQSDKYESVLIKSYEELAQHYNTAIIPARVRAPKDKPSVEGNVGHVSTWITAALRNEQFFSLAELNDSIREKLNAYNARKFQKKECSRLSLFLGEEMPLLAPLADFRTGRGEYCDFSA